MTGECAHPKTVRIFYGLPGPELMERAEAGEVALGGCMVGPPGRRCVTCGLEIHEDVDEEEGGW